MKKFIKFVRTVWLAWRMRKIIRYAWKKGKEQTEGNFENTSDRELAQLYRMWTAMAPDSPQTQKVRQEITRRTLG